MNIAKIREIVNDDSLLEPIKRMRIISCIAEDKNAIPTVLSILAAERESKDELITDMNLELSRADEALQNPLAFASDKSAKDYIKFQQAKEFILNNITGFYIKYKGKITHCFNKQI